MPVDRCMDETTSTQFVMWIEYLNQEWNVPTKLDLYLAQIATEIRRTILKDPRKPKVKDFILKFTDSNKKEQTSVSKVDAKTKMERSKAFWLGALGIKRKK